MLRGNPSVSVTAPFVKKKEKAKKAKEHIKSPHALTAWEEMKLIDASETVILQYMQEK